MKANPVKLNRYTVLFTALIIFTFAQNFYRVFIHYHNLDVAFNYQMGKAILQGQKPYIDFIDFNFPIIWYISAIPASIAQYIHYDSAILAIFFIVLVSVSFYLCHRIIKNGKEWEKSKAFMFLCIILFALTNFQLYDFGQREHLFCIMLLPYVLRRSIGNTALPSKFLEFTIGFLLMVGSSIKPYFLLVFVLVEFYFFLKRRETNKVSTSLVIGIMAGGIVTGSILIYHLSEYLVIASYAVSTYAGQNAILGVNPIAVILKHKISFIVYFSVLLLYPLRRVEQYKMLHEVLVVSALGLLLCAVIQMKGFDYHIKAGGTFAIISFAVAALRFGVSENKYFVKLRQVSFVLLCVIVLLRQLQTATALLIDNQDDYLPTAMSRRAERTLTSHGKIKTIFKLSTYSQPLYPPIMNTDIKDITGCNTLWYLGSFYNNENQSDTTIQYKKPTEMFGLEKMFFENIIHKLITQKPDLLIVAEPGNNFFFSVPNFDIFKYYSQDERFVSVFSEYHPIAQSDGHIWYKRNNISQ